MIARGSIWTTLGCGLLLVLIGCKTPQPDLKPPKQPEILAKPPDEARFNSPAYPKQALVNNDDPTKKWANSGGAGAGMPQRGGGGMGPGGPGGPAGGGGAMGGFGR